jgi:hypothetical protein
MCLRKQLKLAPRASEMINGAGQIPESAHAVLASKPVYMYMHCYPINIPPGSCWKWGEPFKYVKGAHTMLIHFEG